MKAKKIVETITHDDASRKNIPTTEYQSVMRKDEQDPIRVAYERRNRSTRSWSGGERKVCAIVWNNNKG